MCVLEWFVMFMQFRIRGNYPVMLNTKLTNVMKVI